MTVVLVATTGKGRPAVIFPVSGRLTLPGLPSGYILKRFAGYDSLP